VKAHSWPRTLPLAGGCQSDVRERRASRWLLAVLLAALVAVTLPARTALAQGGPPVEDVELAEMYAPVLYFHPAEVFRPQSVDVMVHTARLRQARRVWFDINVRLDLAVPDLFDYRDDSYVLDVWYGDAGSSDYKNYTAHRSYYRAVLSPQTGGPPIIAYAHVVRDETPGYITIQYWLFYYYNDWFNKHEGDWEMVEVVLTAAGEPQWAVLSQHHGGTRRSWSTTQVEGGTHPAVSVALGSHANYFWGDEVYPNGMTIGDARVEIMDRTGAFGRVVPEVVLISKEEEGGTDHTAHRGHEWLYFGGHWGERAVHSDFGGPLGPADKGEQWQRPHAWGMAQPLDSDTWYANRLRVAVAGETAGEARVTLRAADGSALPMAESLGSVALLHADLALGASLVADVEGPPGAAYDLVATLPDAETARVTRYRFDGVPASASGLASLVLRAGEPPLLTVADGAGEVSPTAREVEAVTWDAPDLVWLAGALPVSDVVAGVTTSLLAGVLPTLLYVGVLYWADRYEKEPGRLLATAFLWGAIPALLIAVIVRLLFRLPVDLLGPEAIEAVRAGMLAPLVEEALKGAVILYIAVRYRHEFDGVLDGIVYGAMVGFGFAMTGNTVSYLGAFILRGFEGLSTAIFLEGILYGLNHALYAAIFGAGLGYAVLARQQWQRWAVPLGSFVLAVVCHALHNLSIRNVVGLSLLTVVVTWAGVVVIVVVIVWSLRRQRQCLKAELAGEVPDTVYRTMTVTGGRRRALWQALWGDGLRGWHRARRSYQDCAELAFKKMRHRRRPDQPGLLEEIERLRQEIGKTLGGG
jgi:RsiW-degrading membrane proteinase PrsW (M82 family)